MAVLAAQNIIADTLLTGSGNVSRAVGASGDGLGGPITASNPSGAGGSTAGWSVGSNTTLTAPASSAFGSSYTHCLQAACTGAGNRLVTTQLVNVEPDLPLTLTLLIYLSLPAANATANINVRLYDPTGVTILATTSIVITNNVQAATITFTTLQIGGYYNPILSIEAPDTTPETFNFVAAAPQPPGDSSIYVGVAAAPVRANSFGSNVTGYTGSSCTVSHDTTRGKFSANRLTATLTAGNGSWRTPGDSLTGASIYTASLWLSSPVGKTQIVDAVRADGTTVIASTSTITGTLNPQLVTLTFTAAATETTYIRIRDTSNTTYAMGCEALWIDPGSVSLPFAGEAGSRAAGVVSTTPTLIQATQGAVVLHWRPGWASAGAGPNAAPRLFVAQDGGGTNRVMAVALPSSGGVQIERDDASGTNYTAVAALWTAGTTRTDAFGWSAAVLAANPALAGWTSGANTKTPTGLTTFTFGCDTVSAAHELCAQLLWAVVCTGDYTKLDFTKPYWTQDADPSLTQIQTDSPLAGAVAVIPFTTLAVSTYTTSITAGTLAIAPAYTAKIAFSGFPYEQVTPAINTPPAGIQQIYYRANSAYYVTLVGVADAGSVLVIPGETATAYATVTNKITGAVYQAALQCINGAPGAFSIVLPSAAFVNVTYTLVTVTIYDWTGSSGTVFGSFEAILLPHPLRELQYRRNALNRLLITQLTDQNGNLCTPTTVTPYLTMTDAYTGASLVAQTAAIYDAPGKFHVDAAAFAGEPVALTTVDIYDAAGVTGGNRLAQFDFQTYRGA